MWRIDVEVEVVFLSYRDQESGPEGSSLKVRLGSQRCKVKSQVQSSRVEC